MNNREYLKQMSKEYNFEIVNDKNLDNIVIDCQGVIITKSFSNFKKSFYIAEKTKELIKLENEVILKQYIKNKSLWFTLKTSDGIVYDTNTSGYNRIIKYRRDFENIVNKNNHKLLSTYIRSRDKVLIDYNCGHPARWVCANSYSSSNIGCPICSQKRILPYVNDCYTLRNDLLKYFINEEDSVGIGVYDKERRLFICPNCKNVSYNTLRNISYFGFSCPICKNNNSYPERFMSNLLTLLKIDYKIHSTFDWSNYYYNDTYHKGEYDFWLINENIIIEMDGKQHYEDSNRTKVKTVKEIDRLKQDLAEKNGLTVIRVDCNYNHAYERFEHVKNSIISSLSTYFDLSNIDWNKIDSNCMQSSIVEVCDLWNKGYNFQYISDVTKFNKCTIRSYLKIGSDNNICFNYNTSESHRRTNKIMPEVVL